MPKPLEKNTTTSGVSTTDLLEKIQKMNDEWFIKELPPRPGTKKGVSQKGEEDIDEQEENYPKLGYFNRYEP